MQIEENVTIVKSGKSDTKILCLFLIAFLKIWNCMKKSYQK